MKYRKYLTFNDRADEFTVPLDVNIIGQKVVEKQIFLFALILVCVVIRSRIYNLFSLTNVILNRS